MQNNPSMEESQAEIILVIVSKEMQAKGFHDERHHWTFMYIEVACENKRPLPVNLYAILSSGEKCVLFLTLLCFTSLLRV